MGKYDEYYVAIDDIKECLKRELFGTDQEEVLEDVEPLSSYVTGILFPRKASDHSYEEFTEDAYNANDDLIIEDQVNSDEAVIGANKYRPSSMGITVAVPSRAEKLNVVFQFGTYRYEKKEKEIEIGSENGYVEKKTVQADYYYRVQQRIQICFALPDKPDTVINSFEADVSESSHVSGDLILTVRRVFEDGSRLITVSAVNKTVDFNKLYFRNERPLFQCKLALKSEFPFLPVYQNSFLNNDIESQIRTLLYSSIKNYAYGHGCSVDYHDDEEIHMIESTFLPTEQVLQMRPGDIKNKDILSLSYLKTADKESACQQLMS